MEQELLTEQRILTYRGPATWLNSCAARSFCALEKELGDGKSITSEWQKPQLQRLAICTASSEKSHQLPDALKDAAQDLTEAQKARKKRNRATRRANQIAAARNSKKEIG
ncbi:MAG: hypothetical protein ACLQLH_02570 [Terracidiphilus sp.]